MWKVILSELSVWKVGSVNNVWAFFWVFGLLRYVNFQKIINYCIRSSPQTIIYPFSPFHQEWEKLCWRRNENFETGVSEKNQRFWLFQKLQISREGKVWHVYSHKIELKDSGRLRSDGRYQSNSLGSMNEIDGLCRKDKHFWCLTTIPTGRKYLFFFLFPIWILLVKNKTSIFIVKVKRQDGTFLHFWFLKLRFVTTVKFFFTFFNCLDLDAKEENHNFLSETSFWINKLLI